jgi:hypothetical protein
VETDALWLSSGNVKIEELRSRIQELADGLGIVVKDRNYDSEQIILSMLLDAREDQVTVLQWNGKSGRPMSWNMLLMLSSTVVLLCFRFSVSLSKSPLVVRALELSQSRVIIVSPVGVEHGPLPSSVVGVLSGEFGPKSLVLVFYQRTVLLRLNTSGFWNQSMSLAINAAANLLDSDSAKKKKKVLTCHHCGEEGHTQRNCPKK